MTEPANDLNTSTDSDLLASGIGVVETKTNPTYFYRIPNSDECLRFFVRTQISGISLQCCICRGIYKRTKRERGVLLQEKARKSDGYSMNENPLLNHLKGCKPEVYSEVVKNYCGVPTDYRGQPREFPLVQMRKHGALAVAHRLQNDPTKCYMFVKPYLSKNACVIVQCSTCFDATKTAKEKLLTDTRIGHRVNETGFLDDPCSRHVTACRPLDYEIVMKTRECAEKDRAMNFLSGKFHWHVSEKKTDFQVSVYQKKNDIYFFNENPSRPTYGQIFYQLNRNDNSQLVCASCLQLDDPANISKVVIRKSDGFSMEIDPTENHLDHCKDKFWRTCSVVKFIREEGSRHKERKYEFCIDKVTRKEQYISVYRLNEDASLCYKFQSTSYAFKTGHLHVHCTQCSVMINKARATRKRNKITEKPNEIFEAYKCTSSGFLSDPAVGHLPGCEPLQFEQIKEEYAIATEEDATAFFKQRFTETQTHGIKTSSKSAHPKKANAANPDENINSSLSNDANRGNSENIAPIFSNNKKKVQSISARTEDNAKTVQLETFSKCFEIPFFAEEEVVIGIKGRTLTLTCDRKVSSTGAASCYLAYSADLPNTVDISTIHFTWNDGQMSLTANYH